MNLPRLTRKLLGELRDGSIFARVPKLGRAAMEYVHAQWKGPRCVLPDFLIVGAMKAGTTFLYWVLKQHPQIVVCAPKEVNYFNHKYHRSLNSYRTHFPTLAETRSRSAQTGLPTIAGEASLYLYHPHAARRIARHLPHAKIIILLRDPVKRTISDYHHMKRLGRETLSFEEAIAAEAGRLHGEREKILADESYTSIPYLTYGYAARSIYVDQIAEFHRHFPKEQVLIVPSEEMYADPVRIGFTVHRFLGVEPRPPEAIRPINTGNYKAPQGPVIDYLHSFFEPHNARLYEYLGVDFGWDRPRRRSNAA
jgi:hypothetical protein